MNPIALAGLFGLAKGLLMQAQTKSKAHQLAAVTVGPVLEELVFRAPQRDPVLSSAMFAAAHLTPELLTKAPRFSAYRFAEVFAGGLTYDQAFKKHGLVGAIGAHCLHNALCFLGSRLRGK